MGEVTYNKISIKSKWFCVVRRMICIYNIFRPKPVEERPKWLDDPRGAYGRPDALPKDFPRERGPNGAMYMS